ncbi:MAG: 2-C-methyl-D-erythritol 4-phosphate cytidylyltransferase [Kosmotoga sp.]|nr:MAG: 2-C-methyl-D-erythritol 4-phosphate cytidylyltransferase [Kosmotoga sp.]
MNIAAIVVAGGSGKRFGGSIPKQFLTLKGKEIFIRSVEIFHRSSLINRVVLVVNKNWENLAKKLLIKHDLGSIELVEGGITRQQSVYKGLKYLENNPPDKVLIHDAVRPLFNGDQIDVILNKIKRTCGAVFARAVNETIYKAENNKVIDSPPREKFWLAETPQGFVYKEILEAHKRGLKESQIATDEVQLYRKYIGEVIIIPSTFPNPKITTSGDIIFAETLIDRKK